jgi:hypothetical protein
MKEKSLEGRSAMLGMPSWGPRGEVGAERVGERTRWAGWGTTVAVLAARGLLGVRGVGYEDVGRGSRARLCRRRGGPWWIDG